MGYSIVMTTATLIKKLNKEVRTLQRDVSDIKKVLSLPAAVIRDPEGEYRASFVRKALKRAQNKGPVHRFTTKEAFLKHVRSPK